MRCLPMSNICSKYVWITGNMSPYKVYSRCLFVRQYALPLDATFDQIEWMAFHQPVIMWDTQLFRKPIKRNCEQHKKRKIECYIPNFRLLWNPAQLNGNTYFLAAGIKQKSLAYIELHKYVFVPMGQFEHVFHRFKIDSTKKQIAARKMHVQTIWNKYDPSEPKINHKQYELYWASRRWMRCSDNSQFETLLHPTLSEGLAMSRHSSGSTFRSQWMSKHLIISFEFGTNAFPWQIVYALFRFFLVSALIFSIEK